MECSKNMPVVYVTPEDEKTWVPLHVVLPVVGMKKVNFYYHVRHHAVRSRKSELNERDNEYNLADAKRLRAKRDNQEVKYEEHSHTGLRWVTSADLGYLAKLEFDLSGTYPEDSNLFVRWLGQNNRIALGAFDQERPTECLAYLSAMPVAELPFLHQLREGASLFSLIENLDVLPYGEPGLYTLVIHAIAYREEKYLQEVLRGLVDYWKTLLPERLIYRLYGLGFEKGDVFQSLGFSQLSVITPEDTLQTLPAYHLEIGWHVPVVNPIFRDYQEALNQTASQQNGEEHL